MHSSQVTQSGNIGLEVVSLSVVGELNLSSQGLRQGQAEYTNSFSAWVGKFLAELLGEGDLLGGVLSGISGNNIILNLPSQTINVVLNVKADINIAAIMKYGTSGLLFSDLAIEVIEGTPINKTFMEIYYLGSSRLEKTGNIYTLTTNGNTFSDAIYLNLEGLGLGGIAFHGLAGLLGASTKKLSGTASSSAEAADAVAVSTASDEVAVSQASGSLYLELGIEHGGFF